MLSSSTRSGRRWWQISVGYTTDCLLHGPMVLGRYTAVCLIGQMLPHNLTAVVQAAVRAAVRGVELLAPQQQQQPQQQQ